MRNWTSHAAFRVAQFLFYYRLVGVLAFELTGERAMLLLFPNTFEFFFIVYALIALRWEPSRWPARFWVPTAAVLWIFVKLPQEYWIHIAQLDFTDTVADHPWFGSPACSGCSRSPPSPGSSCARGCPRPTGTGASPPTAAGIARRGARAACSRLRRGGVLWGELAEKISLLALISVIFAEILPDGAGQRGRGRRSASP